MPKILHSLLPKSLHFWLPFTYAPDNNWREEEWDALTDGQYGDFPGGDIDYDTFGFGG